MGRLDIPPPRAHLQGTLALLDALEATSGGHPQAGVVRDWLVRPQDLPPQVHAEHNSMKYDLYLTQDGDQTRWGVTVCDRYEPGQLPWMPLVRQLGGAYRMDGVSQLVAGLVGHPAVTVSVGFDTPAAPPRLKLYLQEDRWDAGVGTAAHVGPLLAQIVPGCALPDWVPPDRAIGVVSLECRPTGERGFKIYLGGASPQAAAAGAPADAQDLADAMAAESSLDGGWFYLTVRIRPGEPPRYALNRIYNAVQLGFAEGGEHLDAGWQDVSRQFIRAGCADAFEALTRTLQAVAGVRVVPTATALEQACTSADVYFAGWSLGAESL